MAQTDIQVLLSRIKEGIHSVETEGPDSSVLSQIESDFIEMLELIKLFLISERDSYYGFFLMSMRFKASFASDGIAGIRLGVYPPLFESNPLLLCKFDLKEIIYVTCHEIDHVVFNHPAEMLKSNPDKDPALFYAFNLAADASVNDQLDVEVSNGRRFMKAPAGVVNSKTLAEMISVDWLYPCESYRYYLDAILESGVLPEETQPERMLSQFSDEQGGSDAQPGGEDGNADDGNDDVVTASECGMPSDHEWDEDENLDAEELEYAVREFVNSAVDLMSEESRGLMPSDFISRVELLNAPPKISWQSLLKKYVGTISADKRKTRSRLNRRQPRRFDLSGAVDEKALKIAIAIDTSGSVDEEQIRDILNEVLAIIAHRKFQMTVIECDSEVQRVYQVRSGLDVKDSVQGRGGTAFTPVIDFVNGDRYFRDALLIYFTDGWGEHSIPKPLTYRNIWVITRGNYLSVEEPYGAVISMDGSDYE